MTPRPTPPGPDAASGRDENARALRILLAEDDDELRTLLSLTLTGAGYEVVTLADGLELMECLAAYLVPENPIDVDLIITDLRMPWVNGMEVLETIGRYIGFPRTILITAFGDDDVHRQARRLGTAAILDKPFEMEELLRQVRRILIHADAPDA